MKRTYLAASALIASQLLLSGCATTAIESNNDYAADLRNYGPNPLIKASILRDLEARMRAMAMASDSIEPEWGKQFNLRNQAAAFCESSYKAEIRWGDPSCEASSSSANQYLCTVDAMVNCYVNPCDQAFCGTRN